MAASAMDLLVAGTVPDEVCRRGPAADAPVPGTIVRRPKAADFGPYFTEQSLIPDEPGGIDMSSGDLSGIDLHALGDLLWPADFDSKTIWPKALPEGLAPQAIMAGACALLKQK